MWTIMAIHWGLPANDGNPQFFGSTGGTQFSTIYSIQYRCLGRHHRVSVTCRFSGRFAGEDENAIPLLRPPLKLGS